MTEIRDWRLDVGIRFALKFNLIFMDCRLSEIAMSRAMAQLAGGGFGSLPGLKPGRRPGARFSC
jgi:hypothetical protein